MYIQECFKPKFYTTQWGEICAPDEPRTRDGWMINIEREWDFKPEKPKKIKEWRGCRSCWAKFVKKNPEYDCI